ncbi:hypothetical protein [Tamlana crocina]|uniref:Uncharacterized protein n=1 Tax=Tamlana crocina TaxID=393006 RepID=A0ABX1DB15_9FLAO|nr:hypothetical protein [Tamlana crocina]NJX15550.1 hypothetical protein [Tamlana crocina]
MKKLIYLILGFLIGAVLTYYFCPRPEVEEGEPKVVKPKGVISVEQATVLSDNWTRYRKAAVDSAAQAQGREQDDRSVYWPLENVEQYLEYAKHYSDSLGYKMTGIQVYLGVYGKDAGPEKSNLTTMFITPIGVKKDSKSSSTPFKIRVNDKPPIPAFNEGTGSNGGYP